ncbi:MAG: hypothetical protein AABZ55_15390 [Bdellovibrionota bacterium]
MSFLHGVNLRNKRLVAISGMTLVELGVATGLAGIMLIGIMQLFLMDSRVRRTAVQRAEFSDLRKDLLAITSKEKTCVNAFNPTGVPVAQRVLIPLNWVNPNIKDALPPYTVPQIYSGINPAATAVPYLQQNQRTGSLLIGGIELDRVRSFSINARSIVVGGVVVKTSKVLANLRFWTTPDSTAYAGGGGHNTTIGGVMGQAVQGGGFQDYIPVIFEINAASGAVISCYSADTQNLTGRKQSSCLPGQVYGFVSAVTGAPNPIGSWDCRPY